MKDRNHALKQAALRNLLETCLKAAPDGMTGSDIFRWPSIAEQVGTGMPAYGRLSTQLQQMVKHGRIAKVGKGTSTTYHWQGGKPKVTVDALAPLPELKIRVDKQNKTLRLQFAGLAITIEVA